jgi:hypothetical protein
MPQKLIIELSQEATVKYLAYARGKTEAEVNEDCEPSGCTISVDIAPGPFDSCVYAKQNGRLIELGEAKIKLIEVD